MTIERLRANLEATEARLQTLEALADSLAAQRDSLRRYVITLQQDAAAELSRRRAPGGVRPGSSYLDGVPVSVLIALERECRHELQLAEDGS